jgi:hypothetical protein
MKNTYLNLKSAVFAIGTTLLVGSSLGQTCGYTCGGSPCPTVPGTAGTHTVVYCTPGTCTFTVPTHVSNITVEVFGAGGGGGGAWSQSAAHDVSDGYTFASDACAGGGGGGGGGFSGKNFNVVGGNTYTVIVGKGGLGGIATSLSSAGTNTNSGTKGEDGEQSRFYGNGENLTATGGIGGNSSSARRTSSGSSNQYAKASGGAGGTGSGVGATTYTGGRGSYGYPNGSRDQSSAGGGCAGSTGNGQYAYIGFNNTPADLPANSSNPTGPCDQSCTNGNNERRNGQGGTCSSPSSRAGGGGDGFSRGSTNGGNNGNNATHVGGGGSGALTHNHGSSAVSATGGAGAHGMVVIKFTAPLAVTLSNFTVSCENGRTINWSTESERNASHFIVERSRDGADWFEIGRLNAVGTTTQEQHYSLQDKSASYGTSYYRLKEVDYDGQVRVYDVVSSDCSSNSGINVYPNPTQGNFVLEINSETAFEGTAVVYDLNGKALVQREINASKGISLVYFDGDHLANGTYILKIEGENKGQFQPVKLVVN